MNAENVDEDRKRAEVFDALSNPARITILKALSDEPMGFSDLKKKLGIDSSGHLQHHMNKLGDLIKTDDYGKYTLSDQGRDALHSIDTVENMAEARAHEKREKSAHRRSLLLMSTVAVLAVLLVVSSVLATLEYNNALSLKNEIDQRDSTITDRDTLITQLDTAIHLSESMSKLKLPSDSQYLSTAPLQNNHRETTKIFADDNAASYGYTPAYPFTTPWFNGSGPFSSQRVFELTNNRPITLSFGGWSFSVGGPMEGLLGIGGDPVLNVGITVRNDYTPADAGAYIGNRTGSYVSSINLGIRFYTWNGSVIEVPKNLNATRAVSPTASSNTAMGSVQFLLASGQTKQVIFYLSPSAADIEAIDHYEIYVSSLSAY